MAEQLGVWIIGARGAVSTCMISGARAISRGLAPSTGLVSEMADFKPLGLAACGDLVFGGHELRSEATLQQSAYELNEVPGILPRSLCDALKDDYAQADRNIRPGTALGCGPAIQGLSASAGMDARTPKQAVEHMQADMQEFKKRNGLRRMVVINLSSTEPYRETLPAFYEDLGAFRKALDAGSEGFTAAALCACAALDAGFPYINFTPSAASEIPALSQLARERKVPHCGKDGKTGETLMKTVLAPMFVARNLKVMSWEGYNIFGNRDAVVLDNPVNNAAKTKGKDKALREILGDDPSLHTRVRIDYCPSLDDWKTAWNFIHFQGFLGTKMILQFIWQGCDSMLAAPLALDLIRLTDYAQRQGEAGSLKHLNCFFKNPHQNETHDFWRQWAVLCEYVRTAAARKR